MSCSRSLISLSTLSSSCLLISNSSCRLQVSLSLRSSKVVNCSCSSLSCVWTFSNSLSLSSRSLFRCTMSCSRSLISLSTPSSSCILISNSSCRLQVSLSLRSSKIVNCSCSSLNCVSTFSNLVSLLRSWLLYSFNCS